ncbi:Centrosomal protein of 170 kDa protein B [Durusdinium trenchii]|uniref:Centrosomal protein of 170 kDa protein B n=1 Tax=Durusdinium trenchii TaxID=1381693 RepID=A0ABP0SQG3_9DINO
MEAARASELEINAADKALWFDDVQSWIAAEQDDARPDEAAGAEATEAAEDWRECSRLTGSFLDEACFVPDRLTVRAEVCEVVVESRGTRNPLRIILCLECKGEMCLLTASGELQVLACDPEVVSAVQAALVAKFGQDAMDERQEVASQRFAPLVENLLKNWKMMHAFSIMHRRQPNALVKVNRLARGPKVKEGYLEMALRSDESPVRRYCLLSEDCLHWFDSDRDAYCPAGAVILRHAHVEVVEADAYKGRFRLVLWTPLLRIVAEAPHRAEMLDWVGAIIDVVGKLTKWRQPTVTAPLPSKDAPADLDEALWHPMFADRFRRFLKDHVDAPFLRFVLAVAQGRDAADICDTFVDPASKTSLQTLHQHFEAVQDALLEDDPSCLEPCVRAARAHLEASALPEFAASELLSRELQGSRRDPLERAEVLFGDRVLVVDPPGGGVSRVIPLPQRPGRISIGRDPANDVVLAGDPRVSRQHCVLLVDAQDRCVLLDAGSTRRTQVNGVPVEAEGLRASDRVQARHPRREMIPAPGGRGVESANSLQHGMMPSPRAVETDCAISGMPFMHRTASHVQAEGWLPSQQPDAFRAAPPSGPPVGEDLDCGG